MNDKSKKGTLLWVLDKTLTSMGGRLLRRWLSDPLIDVLEINRRLDAVKELKDDIMLFESRLYIFSTKPAQRKSCRNPEKSAWI